MRSVGPLTAALVGAFAFAGVAWAAFPGANGRIVFVRSGSQLVSVGSTGRGERVIVDGLSVSAPRWSPDGARIVFSGSKGDEQPPSSRIFVVNADGSGLRGLTESPAGTSDSDPSWSPDGRQIVFGRSYPSPIVGAGGVPPRAATPSLFVIRADGNGLRLLARDGRSPAWSPDGTSIAFVVHHEAGPAAFHWLAVMKSDGTGRHRLTGSGSTEEDSPTWSPDGRRIVFTDAGRIVSIRRDGSDPVQLTDGRLADGSPAYSPDGRWIVFVRFFATKGAPPYRLVVMARDGSRQRELLATHASTFAPDWQPLPRRRLGG